MKKWNVVSGDHSIKKNTECDSFDKFSIVQRLSWTDVILGYFNFRYHVDLFEEMRNTQTVSVWPVGLAGGLMVEKPRLGDSPAGDSKQVIFFF